MTTILNNPPLKDYFHKLDDITFTNLFREVSLNVSSDYPIFVLTFNLTATGTCFCGLEINEDNTSSHYLTQLFHFENTTGAGEKITNKPQMVLQKMDTDAKKNISGVTYLFNSYGKQKFQHTQVTSNTAAIFISDTRSIYITDTDNLISKIKLIVDIPDVLSGRVVIYGVKHT